MISKRLLLTFISMNSRNSFLSLKTKIFAENLSANMDKQTFCFSSKEYLLLIKQFRFLFQKPHKSVKKKNNPSFLLYHRQIYWVRAFNYKQKNPKNSKKRKKIQDNLKFIKQILMFQKMMLQFIILRKSCCTPQWTLSIQQGLVLYKTRKVPIKLKVLQKISIKSIVKF